jgi:prepilin-type N-terminal cleavage/methylation domain-containing protein
MLKNNTKDRSGFTIIEVLIVLAIAGLILLIVFLAVPALQRNSRNTQYKNDAASLLAAATEFTNNNNGTTVTSANESAVKALTKTKAITNISINTDVLTPQDPTFDTARIVTGVKCPATVSGTTVTPVVSAKRALIIVYAVEDAAGTDLAQCTES